MIWQQPAWLFSSSKSNYTVFWVGWMLPHLIRSFMVDIVITSQHSISYCCDLAVPSWTFWWYDSSQLDFAVIWQKLSCYHEQSQNLSMVKWYYHLMNCTWTITETALEWFMYHVQVQLVISYSWTKVLEPNMKRPRTFRKPQTLNVHRLFMTGW